MNGITIEIVGANSHSQGKARQFGGFLRIALARRADSEVPSEYKAPPLPEPTFSNAIAQDLQVINLKSFSNFAARMGETFESYYYTNLERNITDFGARRIQYLAGRFAAKSAIAFVLGKEDDRDGFWLDLEIQRLPTGEPSVRLSDRCQEIAMQLGINKWLLSISHTSDYAAAMAIALK
jgi:holo-[acyl-carrier protein] synthase